MLEYIFILKERIFVYELEEELQVFFQIVTSFQEKCV